MPKTVKYDYSVFIEALVTDEPGFLPEVRISTTVPLPNSKESEISEQPEPINNAEVFLVCDDGSEYEFNQPDEFDQESLYLLSDSSFITETGKSYKLVIYLDGETLESDFEKLAEPSPIDSLGYVVKTQKQTEDGTTEQGYQFLVSNHNDNPAPSYYRWIPDATFYFFVPYVSSFIWNGQELVPYSSANEKACWKNKNINGIYVSTTEGLSQNSIIKAPLHYESQYGDELTNIYSLHVKQLTISESCYNFWNEISKMIYESGGLFERQPFRVSGNITCTSNPDFSVIGIFEVAGTSEYRAYFRTPREFPVWWNNCHLTITNTQDNPLENLPPGSFVKFDPETFEYTTSSEGCFDCTMKGGTTTKPPFWAPN
ncbi:MAG: DUF4249 domain-containing protein [Draconibacterium sp.]